MVDGLKLNGLNWLSMAVAGVLLGACNGNLNFGGITPEVTSGDASTQPGAPVVAFNRFPDLPIPPGGEINLEKTLVFGADESWFGRLTVDSSLDPNELFNFFKQEVPGFGWREITSIRSALSVLTYTRGKRVATIQIQGQIFSGATASITVSPQDSGAASQMDQQKAPEFTPRRRSMTAPISPVQRAPSIPPAPAPVLRGR